ncbi:MAG: hypothetical protein ACPHXW_00460, partial [Marinobacterium sp.]
MQTPAVITAHTIWRNNQARWKVTVGTLQLHDLYNSRKRPALVQFYNVGPCSLPRFNGHVTMLYIPVENIHTLGGRYTKIAPSQQQQKPRVRQPSQHKLLEGQGKLEQGKGT